MQTELTAEVIAAFRAEFYPGKTVRYITGALVDRTVESIIVYNDDSGMVVYEPNIGNVAIPWHLIVNFPGWCKVVPGVLDLIAD